MATAPAPSSRLREQAATLAARLPSLVVAARRIAQSVMHGVHGRRQAGPGETFWQFRPFVSGEPAARVDWRRSARENHAFVREREWEAAHTLWLWFDRSASMAFGSELAASTKLDRAAVLTLALADLAVRGGERVGLLGLSRPIAARGIIDRFAEILAASELADRAAPSQLPPVAPIAARSKVVLIGDFLSPGDEVARSFAAIGSNGAEGQVLMICDPLEETFPFHGHTEFLAPAERRTAARASRPKPSRRLSGAAGRATRGRSLGFGATRLGLRPAPHRRIGGGGAAEPARAPLRARTRQPRLGGLTCSACRSPSPRPRSSSLSSALGALYYFLRVTPPRPRQSRISAAPAAAGPGRQGNDAGQDALAAAAAAAGDRRGGRAGDGRADLERGEDGHRPSRRAARRLRRRLGFSAELGSSHRGRARGDVGGDPRGPSGGVGADFTRRPGRHAARRGEFRIETERAGAGSLRACRARPRSRRSRVSSPPIPTPKSCGSPMASNSAAPAASRRN